ncbi:NUMOD1 domain-containing DNA-binding protein [Falsirhodobacter xinxiangensis]|uniref:NUMOD1 domain-containing DNA-binding protein n=1 Tax=Falsirhodobacter xinxiangensis TaxID=2530049 RepID=UPI0010A99B5F|nr:NUMOD1 domain-containing DNA-binding protein [Rhodobacter xinxiangensis]
MNAMTPIHPEDVIRERMIAMARRDRAAIAKRHSAPVEVQPVKIAVKAAPRSAYAPPRPAPVLPRIRPSASPAPRPVFKPKQIAHQPGTPVTIRGVEYPSPIEAAKALSVSRQTIYVARTNGRLDFVGLGRGAGNNRHEVTIEDVTYPSHSDAARALGVSRYYVARMAEIGRFITRAEHVAITREQVLELAATGMSCRKMAEVLGLSPSSISNHKRALAEEGKA